MSLINRSALINSGSPKAAKGSGICSCASVVVTRGTFLKVRPSWAPAGWSIHRPFWSSAFKGIVLRRRFIIYAQMEGLQLHGQLQPFKEASQHHTRDTHSTREVWGHQKGWGSENPSLSDGVCFMALTRPVGNHPVRGDTLPKASLPTNTQFTSWCCLHTEIPSDPSLVDQTLFFIVLQQHMNNGSWETLGSTCSLRF